HQAATRGLNPSPSSVLAFRTRRILRRLIARDGEPYRRWAWILGALIEAMSTLSLTHHHDPQTLKVTTLMVILTFAVQLQTHRTFAIIEHNLTSVDDLCGAAATRALHGHARRLDGLLAPRAGLATNVVNQHLLS